MDSWALGKSDAGHGGRMLRLGIAVPGVVKSVAAVSGGSRAGVRIWHDARDELPDFLDFVLASVGDEAAGEGLRCEQRGAGDAGFGLAARPFAAVERLDCELDDELIGRDLALSGSVFDASPLLGGDPDVLLL